MKLINNLPQKLDVQTQLGLFAREISQLQADLAHIKEQLTMDSQEPLNNERRTS